MTSARPAPGALVRLAIVGSSAVDGVALAEVLHDAEQRGGRLLGVADEADERDDRQQAREQREHGVVGERGGQVGALVLAELAHRLADDVLPGRLGQVRRVVGLVGGLRLRGAFRVRRRGV